MTTTNHTPGPWTARVATASVPTMHIHSPRGHFASVYGARHVQDARLIAAAPDLLAALRALDRIERGLQGWHEDSKAEAWSRARAAIAKAEGRDNG